MVTVKPLFKVLLIAKDVTVQSGVLVKPGDFVIVKLSRGGVNSYVFAILQKVVSYSIPN